MSRNREEILQRACAFLARREHSRKELFNKLLRICPDKELLEDLLDKLCREDLQSDERFTESFVHHRINNGQGSLKIAQELQQRGIAQNLIETFLISEAIDWLALAADVRIKKYGANIPKDYHRKAKQSQFLHSRGFNRDIINQLLR